MARALFPLFSREKTQERMEYYTPFYVEGEVLSDKVQAAFVELVAYTVPSDHSGALEDFGIFASHPTVFQFTAFQLLLNNSRVENLVINLLEIVQPRRGNLNLRLNENDVLSLQYKRNVSIANMAFRVVLAGFLFGRVVPTAPV